MIRVNLNTIFYTQIDHSPTETISTKYYMEPHTHRIQTCMSKVTDQANNPNNVLTMKFPVTPAACGLQVGQLLDC